MELSEWLASGGHEMVDAEVSALQPGSYIFPLCVPRLQWDSSAVHMSWSYSKGLPDVIRSHSAVARHKVTADFVSHLQHVWVGVDSTLYLWNFRCPKDSSPLVFNFESTIHAVAFFPPQPEVLADNIVSLVVVSTDTTVELRALGLIPKRTTYTNSASNTSPFCHFDASKHPIGSPVDVNLTGKNLEENENSEDNDNPSFCISELDFPGYRVEVTTDPFDTVCVTDDGHVFLSCDANIFELCYQKEPGWFSLKCSLKSLSSSVWMEWGNAATRDAVVVDMRTCSDKYLFVVDSSARIRLFEIVPSNLQRQRRNPFFSNGPELKSDIQQTGDREDDDNRTGSFPSSNKRRRLSSNPVVKSWLPWRNNDARNFSRGSSSLSLLSLERPTSAATRLRLLAQISLPNEFCSHQSSLELLRRDRLVLFPSCSVDGALHLSVVSKYLPRLHFICSATSKEGPSCITPGVKSVSRPGRTCRDNGHYYAFWLAGKGQSPYGTTHNATLASSLIMNANDPRHNQDGPRFLYSNGVLVEWKERSILNDLDLDLDLNHHYHHNNNGGLLGGGGSSIHINNRASSSSSHHHNILSSASSSRICVIARAGNLTIPSGSSTTTTTSPSLLSSNSQSSNMRDYELSLPCETRVLAIAETVACFTSHDPESCPRLSVQKILEGQSPLWKPSRSFMLLTATEVKVIRLDWHPSCLNDSPTTPESCCLYLSNMNSYVDQPEYPHKNVMLQRKGSAVFTPVFHIDDAHLYACRGGGTSTKKDETPPSKWLKGLTIHIAHTLARLWKKPIAVYSVVKDQCRLYPPVGYLRVVTNKLQNTIRFVRKGLPKSNHSQLVTSLHHNMDDPLSRECLRVDAIVAYVELTLELLQLLILLSPIETDVLTHEYLECHFDTLTNFPIDAIPTEESFLQLGSTLCAALIISVALVFPSDLSGERGAEAYWKRQSVMQHDTPPIESREHPGSKLSTLCYNLKNRCPTFFQRNMNLIVQVMQLVLQRSHDGAALTKKSLHLFSNLLNSTDPSSGDQKMALSLSMSVFARAADYRSLVQHAMEKFEQLQREQSAKHTKLQDHQFTKQQVVDVFLGIANEVLQDQHQRPLFLDALFTDKCVELQSAVLTYALEQQETLAMSIFDDIPRGASTSIVTQFLLRIFFESPLSAASGPLDATRAQVAIRAGTLVAQLWWKQGHLAESAAVYYYIASCFPGAATLSSRRKSYERFFETATLIESHDTSAIGGREPRSVPAAAPALLSKLNMSGIPELHKHAKVEYAQIVKLQEPAVAALTEMKCRLSENEESAPDERKHWLQEIGSAIQQLQDVLELRVLFNILTQMGLAQFQLVVLDMLAIEGREVTDNQYGEIWCRIFFVEKRKRILFMPQPLNAIMPLLNQADTSSEFFSSDKAQTYQHSIMEKNRTNEEEDACQTKSPLSYFGSRLAPFSALISDDGRRSRAPRDFPGIMGKFLDQLSSVSPERRGQLYPRDASEMFTNLTLTYLFELCNCLWLTNTNQKLSTTWKGPLFVAEGIFKGAVFEDRWWMAMELYVALWQARSTLHERLRKQIIYDINGIEVNDWPSGSEMSAHIATILLEILQKWIDEAISNPRDSQVPSSFVGFSELLEILQQLESYAVASPHKNLRRGIVELKARWQIYE